MKKILTIGNALLDSLITIPNNNLLSRFTLQKGSMSLQDSDTIHNILMASEALPKESSMGGSAGNCVRALAHLGCTAGYVGKVGDDSAGEAYGAQLEQLGIKPHLFKSNTTPTGQCLSLIGEDGERTMATYLGAALELEAEEITAELFEGYDILFVEGYLVQNPPLIERIFEVARGCSVAIAIDLASYNVVEQSLELLRSLVEVGVAVIFANEQEAEAFTGESDPMAGAEKIAQMCDVAVVKIGSRGSIVIAGDEVVEVGATSHVRRDTTGAGDYFAAGFIAGFCLGESLVKCAQMGSVTGGAVVEVVGTTLDNETWRDIKRDIAVILK